MNSYKSWLEYLKQGIYGKGEDFLKFAILWLSFNAYLNEIPENKKKKIRDTEKVKNFSRKKNTRRIYNDMPHQEMVRTFALTGNERTYIENLKDNKLEKRKYFNLEKNACFDFFQVLYQIRCNFFHGDKIPTDNTDKLVIKWAYDNFYTFWSRYLDVYEK